MRFFLGIGNKDLALVAVEKTHKRWMWLALIGINLVYACTYICMKMASPYAFLSAPYILWVAGAIGVMGVYAVLWQQVLARVPLSTAYMFKGTSLIFVLLLSAMLFHEEITWQNVLGSFIIVSGIVLFAKS